VDEEDDTCSDSIIKVLLLPLPLAPPVTTVPHPDENAVKDGAGTSQRAATAAAAVDTPDVSVAGSSSKKYSTFLELSDVVEVVVPSDELDAAILLF
jgi:hypothetical protein